MRRPLLASILEDILIYSAYIQTDLDGTDVTSYRADRHLRQTTERNLIILGIACGRIREKFPDVFHRFRSFRAAIEVRNRLAHGYDEEIDDDIIFAIATGTIETLRREARRAFQFA